MMLTISCHKHLKGALMQTTINGIEALQLVVEVILMITSYDDDDDDGDDDNDDDNDDADDDTDDGDDDDDNDNDVTHHPHQP